MNDKIQEIEDELVGLAKEMYPVQTQCYSADAEGDKSTGCHVVYNHNFHYDHEKGKLYANADDEDFFCIYNNGVWAISFKRKKEEIPDEVVDDFLPKFQKESPVVYAAFEHWFFSKLGSSDIDESGRSFSTLSGCLLDFLSSYGFEVNFRTTSDGCYMSIYDSRTDQTSEELLYKSRSEGLKILVAGVFGRIEKELQNR